MASIITGTITVNIDAEHGGEFAGIYTGDFSYDDTHLTKVGTETMNIDGANRRLPGLLSLNFRFLDFDTGLTPVTYTASDDWIFPNGPGLYFENGIPTVLAFMVDPGKNGGPMGGHKGLAFGLLGDRSFTFVLQNRTSGAHGTVTLEINKSTSVEPSLAPENPFPLTSLLAVLSLGAAYFWQKCRY
ncbi:MAG: hypothetical protein HC916_15275 [Coleofasciculaceae cyanobacterium SM2_1_6]|nr:hypothetical protein [Coleofasciculaceae cyanobacterium SM2_1_6]